MDRARGIKSQNLAIALVLMSVPTAAQTTPDLRTAPAEPILDRALAAEGSVALAARAENGDSVAGYLLFVDQDRNAHDAAESERWLGRFASTNSPSARYAFALSHYRSDVKAQVKGVEIVDTASPLSRPERQIQITSLEAIAPQFPKAYTLLAAIYRDGIWAPTDLARSSGYLEKGVAAGVASAMMELGVAKLRGGALADAARLGDYALAAGEPTGLLLACAAYSQITDTPAAIARCSAAADKGAPWAQLAAGELLARSVPSSMADARRYLSLGAQSADTAIADRAALSLANLELKAGAIPKAIEALSRAAERNSWAAWELGRLHLDRRADAATALRWFNKAQGLPKADTAAIGFDIARATKSAGGDWIPALRKSADAGHSRAALVLAFELQDRPAEARRYAELAASDSALRDRAQQILDRLGKAPS